jgi:microcystin-dependent protein
MSTGTHKRLAAALIVGLALTALFLPGKAMAQEPFLGEIRMFAGNFAPRGWAFCDGQILPISQYQSLYSLLGTTYGGDGRTTFALPDLRGRVPLHPGTGAGLSTRRLGERSGTETVTLGVTQMPGHSHAATLQASSLPGNTSAPGGNLPAAGRNFYSTGAANVAMDGAGVTVGSAGGGQSHPNMQPYLGINYIIALQGLYPSRN